MQKLEITFHTVLRCTYKSLQFVLTIGEAHKSFYRVS